MNKLLNVMRSVISLGSKLKCSSMVNEADYCDRILEDLRTVADEYDKFKLDAELGTAIRWGAESEMFAINKDGLTLVLQRYREAHSKEAQEGMCPDCGEAMELLRYHEEGYPIFWCINCDPDGPY